LFKDRIEAGVRLAEELTKYKDDDCIILGIPRGGAIIAKQVARELKKPWDIIVPRKIASPFNREIAIGALSQDGSCLIDDNAVSFFNIQKEYINGEIEIELLEINRRLLEYRGSVDFPKVENKDVILVDDGIATGYTFTAALNSIKKHNPRKLIAAVPVAPAEVIDMIGKYVDEIICLEIPRMFISVGHNYLNFEQNSDEDVIMLFKQDDNRRFL